jgi:catechol 2,3-dioxygenase-like lactoylglutathione lyase family enzyme
LGFKVRGDLCQVGTVALELVGDAASGGIVRWALRDSPTAELDGLPTDLIDAGPGAAERHPNGALAIDHIVVMSPSLDRTAAALDDAGVRLRRVRDAGPPDAPIRQGFFRLGEVILEVVAPRETDDRDTGTSQSRAQADASATWPPRPGPSDPASFWGLVFVVADLQRCADLLGEHLGQARDAVQPGRRIATLRRSAGVSVPVAFITPAPARVPTPS